MDLTAELPSTRPYLVRAMHQWCTDHGFTPHLAVHVDSSVRVPLEHVREGQIVLNVGVDATQGLDLGNEFIVFKARFGGVAREIVVPVSHVLAVYARENGQGMAFPAPQVEVDASDKPELEARPGPAVAAGLRLAPHPNGEAPSEVPPDDPTPRPTLKRVK
jgi:stringent starvation protein B